MSVSKRFDAIQNSFIGQVDHEKAIGSLKTPNDAIAVLVHAWALDSGMKLLSVSGKDVEGEKSK